MEGSRSYLHRTKCFGLYGNQQMLKLSYGENCYASVVMTQAVLYVVPSMR
jgi:hypothetical protein